MDIFFEENPSGFSAISDQKELAMMLEFAELRRLIRDK